MATATLMADSPEHHARAVRAMRALLGAPSKSSAGLIGSVSKRSDALIQSRVDREFQGIAKNS